MTVEAELIEMVKKLQAENQKLNRELMETRLDAMNERINRELDSLREALKKSDEKVAMAKGGPHTITMEMGEDNKKVPREFNTKEELLAFMHGVSEGFGWTSQIRIIDITDPKIVDIIDRHGGDIWLVTEEEKAKEQGANIVGEADPDTNGATSLG